jgi:RNA polymerase sigma factor (sigma-70 family)
MSNEDLVAIIQRLSDSERPEDQQRLRDAQARLLVQNAGLIIKIAMRYNRGRALTPDETSEVAMSVCIAARAFDPARGKFSACIPWYIKAALQREHAFTHEVSQAVYARGAAKLNNPDNYSHDEVTKAANVLRPSQSLSEENGLANLLTSLSVEDQVFAAMDAAEKAETQQRLLPIMAEAVAGLTERQQKILTMLLEPREVRDDLGMASTRAVAIRLHMPEQRVTEEKMRIIAHIRRHLAENAPDLCPHGWHDAPIELGDNFILDLFGAPVVNRYARRRI